MDNFDERVQAYLKDWAEFKDLMLTHKKLDDLQQRINQAVEYINKNIAIYHKQLPLIAIDYEEVINILKGDDTNDR